MGGKTGKQQEKYATFLNIFVNFQGFQVLRSIIHHCIPDFKPGERSVPRAVLPAATCTRRGCPRSRGPTGCGSQTSPGPPRLPTSSWMASK